VTALKPRQHLLAAQFINGVGSGGLVAALGVVSAQRYGTATAGLTVAISTLGRFAGVGLMDRFSRLALSQEAIIAAFFKRVSVMTISQLAVLASTAIGPLWLTLLLAVISTSASRLVSLVINTLGKDHVMALGPSFMIGQALGAWIAGVGLLLSSAPLLVIVAAPILVQLLMPSLIARFTFAPLEPHSGAKQHLLKPMLRGMVFGTLCCGPLPIYAVLVKEVASSAWVGPAMLAYGLGGVLAIRAERLFKAEWSQSTELFLGGLGALSWVIVSNETGAVAARFVAGVTLFIAQGKLLKWAVDHYGPTGGISAATLGVGLGGTLGTYLCALLAHHLSVQLMGLVSGSVALAFSAALFAHSKLRKSLLKR
jgi:hypothetical protein